MIPELQPSPFGIFFFFLRDKLSFLSNLWDVDGVEPLLLFVFSLNACPKREQEGWAGSWLLEWLFQGSLTWDPKAIQQTGKA